MIHCTVKGCSSCISETLSPIEQVSKWIIFRACRCGAYNIAERKSCECRSEGTVPVSYWPNLDWYALGGVEEIVICPEHKLEIFEEIIRQRGLDPSMVSNRQNRGNLH